MKIKISDQEVYEIKLDEEITTDQFLGLMERLKSIERLLSKDMMMKDIIRESGKSEMERPRKRGNPVKFDRDLAIQFLKEYYSFNSPRDRDFMLDKYGYKNHLSLRSNAKYLKMKYGFTTDTIRSGLVSSSGSEHKRKIPTTHRFTTASDFDTREKAAKFFNEFYDLTLRFGNGTSAKADKERFSQVKGFKNYGSMKVNMTLLKKKYNLKNDTHN